MHIALAPTFFNLRSIPSSGIGMVMQITIFKVNIVLTSILRDSSTVHCSSIILYGTSLATLHADPNFWYHIAVSYQHKTLSNQEMMQANLKHKQGHI